jgi:hypothetical protein
MKIAPDAILSVRGPSILSTFQSRKKRVFYRVLIFDDKGYSRLLETTYSSAARFSLRGMPLMSSKAGSKRRDKVP